MPLRAAGFARMAGADAPAQERSRCATAHDDEPGMTLVKDSDWIRLLRDDNAEGFNQRALKERPQLENANLRMVDLRKVDLKRANLRGAYLRNADLRGVDLADADLHGASLHDATVAGALFPVNLAAEEITMSVHLGTRMRTRA